MYKVLHDQLFDTIDANNTVDDKKKQVDSFENPVIKQNDLSTHGATQVRASLLNN